MRIHLLNGLIIGTLLLLAVMPHRVAAQPATQSITDLESRVSDLEHRSPTHADGGVAIFLFGAFCALWAQNTGRNAWSWFFLGLLFNVITVLVLLSKNSQDNRQRRPAG